MMSFLCRLALKSAMAAKKESVAQCAGPFQYVVGRLDGANTSIKTIQYLAEADTSRVLVALDLKSGLPKCVSPNFAVQYRPSRCGSCSCLFQMDYTPRSTECTTTLPTPKSVPTMGWIRVVLCQRVDFQLPLTLYSGQFWRTLHTLRLTCHALPTWTIGTFGSSGSTCYKHVSSSLQSPDQSTLNSSPPRFRYGERFAKTVLLNYKTKSKSHSGVLEDISKSTVTSSPALLFWASRPPWNKPNHASSESPPRLPSSMRKDSMRRQ